MVKITISFMILATMFLLRATWMYDIKMLPLKSAQPFNWKGSTLVSWMKSSGIIHQSSSFLHKFYTAMKNTHNLAFEEAICIICNRIKLRWERNSMILKSMICGAKIKIKVGGTKKCIFKNLFWLEILSSLDMSLFIEWVLEKRWHKAGKFSNGFISRNLSMLSAFLENKDIWEHGYRPSNEHISVESLRSKLVALHWVILMLPQRLGTAIATLWYWGKWN